MFLFQLFCQSNIFLVVAAAVLVVLKRVQQGCLKSSALGFFQYSQEFRKDEKALN